MTARTDVLDYSEPLKTPFWTSLAMHVAIIGSLLASALMPSHHLLMGTPNGGGMGSVLVNPVPAIPIPNRGGLENPVANPTQSLVPAAPVKEKEKVKPEPKRKVDELKAIALQDEKVPKKSRPNSTYTDPKQFALQQLHTDGGARASSQIYNQQPGGGGVGLGERSPFGDQFGWYANVIRDNVARNWHPQELGMRGTPFVVITFTILKDGSIANVKVGDSSGIPLMENTAKRAVLDAKLPALPPGFPRTQADVELRFELGK